MKQNLHKIIPHLLFIVGFFLVTFIIYQPQFTENKGLSQHDIKQGIGTTHQLKKYNQETGEVALWNNYVFSGMPAYLDAVNFSNYLRYVEKVLNAGIPRPAHITFRMLLSFYFMLLLFGVRPWIAFAGAIAFGLNGFNIISIMAGHNLKVDAVAYIPIVIGAIHYAFTKNKMVGSLLLALFLGLHIRTGHLQMTYYLLLMVVIYGLVYFIRAIRNKELKPFFTVLAFLIVGASLAVGANFGKLWTTIEYSKYSTRGKSELTQGRSEVSSGLDRSYAFQYSNGIFEPLFLFIPNVMGGSVNESLDEDSNLGQALRRAGMGRQQLRQQLSSVPTYWGDQPLSAPYYAGAVTVFLFVLGMFFIDREKKFFLLGILIFGIMLSWGSSFGAFNYLMFDYFPGYNKFRSVTFAILMPLLSLSLGGFYGLNAFLNEENDKKKIIGLIYAVGITAGFALILIVISGMFGYSGAIDERLPDAYVIELVKDRQSMLIGDSFRAIIFVLIVGALLWVSHRKSLNQKFIYGAIALLVFLDMLTLTKRYLNQDSFVRQPMASVVQQTAADQQMLNNTGPGDRVFNLQNPFNEARTSYYHESLGGYHGAKMQRYQEIIDYYLGSELQLIINSLQSGSRDFSEAKVANMLNATYFFAGNEQRGVFKNNNAYGNAWSVSNVKKVNNADEEINTLAESDLKATAIVDQSKFDLQDKTYSTAEVNLTSKTPNEVKYEVKSQGDAFIVFSEIYYPKGWRATIDGNEADIVRANYLLRAMEVPSGSHEVVFSFEPNSFYVGRTITKISNILILLALAGVVFLQIRQGKKED